MKNIKAARACLTTPNRFDLLNRSGGMLTLETVMWVLFIFVFGFFSMRSVKFESLFTCGGLATLITLNC
ncbi:MAG: hypothetical protein HN758_15245 [Verrucomicrobia bacterium]|jgi:hypothetical protein|nr:hypothetical protein [Verrucomicrobiota bacterium]MBT5478199.1 hypothetical protein [Verrucomicrobiota bacterium]MBT6240226.1 hypothetical protein [Verrucomicrobiota bacterium]MBT6803802.1 hypothetical protein [Verrucomicrobiota bacterium]MBT7535922.1 hypothetical protein [Verrucomicrobiota bacterium]